MAIEIGYLAEPQHRTELDAFTGDLPQPSLQHV
jgi:hypothetical protein